GAALGVCRRSARRRVEGWGGTKRAVASGAGQWRSRRESLLRAEASLSAEPRSRGPATVPGGPRRSLVGVPAHGRGARRDRRRQHRAALRDGRERADPDALLRVAWTEMGGVPRSDAGGRQEIRSGARRAVYAARGPGADVAAGPARQSMRSVSLASFSQACAAMTRAVTAAMSIRVPRVASW